MKGERNKKYEDREKQKTNKQMRIQTKQIGETTGPQTLHHILLDSNLYDPGGGNFFKRKFMNFDWFTFIHFKMKTI